MHHTLPLVFLSSLTCLLTAQAPTVTVRSASLLTTNAHSGPFASAQTLPIGPLPTVGSVDAVVTNGTTVVEASTAWGTTSTSTLAGFVVEQHLVVRGSAGGNCTAGPSQIVFAVACSVPRAATLVVRLTKVASPGLPSTTVMVDVGNDGTFDLTGASPVNIIQSAVAIGPQPLEVRVVLSGNIAPVQPADANLDDLVTVTVEPNNHLTVVPAAAGCVNQAATLLPAWDLDGVVLDVNGAVAPPLVIGVFGLSPAPLLLPNASVALPCLLLPEPDLVVVFAPGGFTLPLPPAVRPATIWAQCVQFDFGIGTTNGFLVNAF